MRVVVLGAGYAGLAAARRLEGELPPEAELVVVDEHDYHLVQHELHRVVRRPGLAEVVRVPLSAVLAEDTTFRRARVTGLDPEAGVVDLDEGRLAYDYAVVCLGAETAFYDLPGVADHAVPLKSLADAERIREGFLAAPADGRVVVGGAGLSGIQVAGELAELARDDGVAGDDSPGTEESPRAAPADPEAPGAAAGSGPEVVLLEQFDRVAPSFPPVFQDAVREELGALGVDVRTGTAVASADGDAVELEGGERLDYDLFVWTGGIRGPDALDGERPAVRNDLRFGDGTFVVGDAARVVDADGEAVPASAQAAVREARVAARNVARLASHDLDADPADPRPRLDRFRFDALGWVVSVGDGAVAQLGPTVLRGGPARAAKASIGASYLGSLGAVREAVDLAREELGWPT